MHEDKMKIWNWRNIREYKHLDLSYRNNATILEGKFWQIKKKQRIKKANKESKKRKQKDLTNYRKNNREKKKVKVRLRVLLHLVPRAVVSCVVVRTDSWWISVALCTELHRVRQSCARRPIDISSPVLKSLVCLSACLSASVVQKGSYSDKSNN